MRSKKKIGCLGFSANPPHLGHLEAAFLVLNEVWLVPCFAHPFDKDRRRLEIDGRRLEFFKTSVQTPLIDKIYRIHAYARIL